MKDQSKIIIELLSQLDNSNLPPTVKTLKAPPLLPFAMEGLFGLRMGASVNPKKLNVFSKGFRPKDTFSNFPI